MLSLPDKYFKAVFWVSKSYTTVRFDRLLLELGDFLNIDISQSSVATCLRCSGIFKYGVITNLLLSATMKEF